MSQITWGSQQQQALDKIGSWWRDNSWGAIQDRCDLGPGLDAFVLDGYAGTGKTTLAKALPELLGCKVSYAAFTGKAASVLRSKGMKDAVTLHSLLFKPRERSEERERLEAELEAAPMEHRARIAEQLLELQDQVSFSSDPEEEPPEPGDLLVVDERSMVDEWLLERIARKFRRVLFLGDPFQLKPVKGMEAPLYANFTLTEVHRHAGPLLEAVTMLRNGEDPEDCQNEAFSWGHQPTLYRCDVILCHRNATRRSVNERQRDRQGHKLRPRAGEPMVVLKNAHGYDLWNGEVYRLARDSVLLDQITIGVELVTREGITYEAERARFQPQVMMPKTKADKLREDRRGFPLNSILQLDYGYSLTVHKSQGSEWPVVGLIHDYRGSRDVDWRRWLYTACTRARERVLVHAE